MKCILAKSFGKPDDVLSDGERPIPTVKPGSGKLLLRVHACSLTPGDYRLLLGTRSPGDGLRVGFRPQPVKFVQILLG